MALAGRRGQVGDEPMKPMLCVGAALSRLTDAARDDGIVFEQKLDGRRLLINCGPGGVSGFGRDGQRVDVPAKIAAALQLYMPLDVWFDGELVVDSRRRRVLWVFDTPGCAGQWDHRTLFRVRRQLLEAIAAGWDEAGWVRIVPQATTPEAKLLLAKRLVEAGAEGVVAKHVDGVYSWGKRTAAALKFKFVHDADCVVSSIGRDGKDSMGLEVYDETGAAVDVGDVTRQAGNGHLAERGDVVAVRYLRFTEGRRLYQPTLPRVRHDKAPAECTLEQFRIHSKEVVHV